MASLGPKAVNQSSIVLCRNKDCARRLYGPVAFCPYCGLSKPTAEDMPPPWRGGAESADAVKVVSPLRVTRAPEPVASQVIELPPQVVVPDKLGEKVAPTGPTAPTAATVSQEIRPPVTPKEAPRFNGWNVVLGLLVVCGVIYFWLSHREKPTPGPEAPASTVAQPVPPPTPVPLLPPSTEPHHVPPAITPVPAGPNSVHRPEPTKDEICAALSTSADRVEFAGKVIDRPNEGRFALFHVQHGSREIPCLVDGIAAEELPKAEAAARSAADHSELKLNLSHTIQELQKAQRALTPSPPGTTDSQ